MPLRLLATCAAVAASLRLRASRSSTGVNPVMIIVAGPTGSGKGGLADHMIEKIGGGREYERFLIDDMVESSPQYGAAVKEILDGLGDSDAIVTALNNPTADLAKAFGDAYFSARRTGDCGYEDNTEGCSGIYKKNLKAAIATKKNIVFETTVRYPNWLIDWTGGDYDIYYAQTLVELCELFRRNQGRAATQALRFIGADYTGPAPRLPDVTFEGGYRKTAMDAKETVEKAVEKGCVLQGGATEVGDAAFCGRYPTKGIVLWDNNPREMAGVTDVDEGTVKTSVAELATKITETAAQTPIKYCEGEKELAALKAE